ncbi:MAG: amidophosphoribosyltransferase [Candidatus Eisenbacteria bacterium]|uniref:Amidophosphoribosyltransferase n=1 Tax=Eiseniibacteriota bacterium TaxID=2212470 RepID=A0A948WBT4_UNCEI|nr:amidophosphoribosyltransferase [Candidatus Eisenbacteria bacterium]MBU1947781.1 amidophosphoribosyltransferase [Candidatus Eisenbacteria bacterium]MBU2690278.1 amidophosphoribosyltransferase [Candidatus Eisenbacteria bacterium]
MAVHGRGDITELLYLGLYALQHRGQEGAGMVTHNGQKTRIIRGLGLVPDSMTHAARARIPGYMGIGHVRYATTGKATKLRNVQPLLVDYKGGKLAVAHNGNFVNARALRSELESNGSIFQTTTDSELLLHLIARSKAKNLVDGFCEILERIEGACTCVALNEEIILGYRDPMGFRPLSLGEHDGMWMFASETCALDIIGARHVRDLEPGELVVLDGKRARTVAKLGGATKPSLCIFEQIYFSRPDSILFGESVNAVRRRLGHLLAQRHPAEADFVISIPDSSNSAALGFAEASGLPFELGLIRNHYIGRTFIQPEQSSRIDSVRIKFNPVREILDGKRVVVVDDSIVRGTTSRKLVEALYESGAREIHFRVSSPPITSPCYYGIDTPSRDELIASKKNVEMIRRFISATSLGFLTEEDLRAAVKDPDHYCMACFNGAYPTRTPEDARTLLFDRD